MLGRSCTAILGSTTDDLMRVRGAWQAGPARVMVYVLPADLYPRKYEEAVKRGGMMSDNVDDPDGLLLS